MAALTAMVLVSGCGESTDGPSSDGPSEPTEGTALTIDVVADSAAAEEGADPTTLTLTCDPAGGDHPQPAEACRALAEAGPDIFEPVPDDQACTMIYGGPQAATVVGVANGKKVNASFSRENGCEIDRWDKLGTTFFNVPLQ